METARLYRSRGTALLRLFTAKINNKRIGGHRLEKDKNDSASPTADLFSAFASTFRHTASAARQIRPRSPISEERTAGFKEKPAVRLCVPAEPCAICGNPAEQGGLLSRALLLPASPPPRETSQSGVRRGRSANHPRLRISDPLKVMSVPFEGHHELSRIFFEPCDELFSVVVVFGIKGIVKGRSNAVKFRVIFDLDQLLLAVCVLDAL